LICDGTSVSRTIYPTLNALYSSQSYPFGNGDGSTTFTLPDLQRRVPIGRRDIDSIGANDGLTLANRTFNHTHTIPAHSHGMAHTHNLPGHYHVHDTAVGSNLNITNSGTHQTTIDINHTHGTFYASNVTLQTELKVTGVSLTDPGHTHNYDAAANTYHGNGITRTASVGESGFAASHDHTGTTSTGGDHTHSLREESGGSTSRANTLNINASTVGTTSTQTRNIVSAGSHSHTFTTAGANTDHWHYIRPATTGCQVADPVGVTDYDGLTRSGHRHNVRCTTPATNPNGGAAWNVGEHNHSVNITALGVTNRSDLTTSGGHTHGTNAFAGNIGNLNSTINGNVTGGTNITQSQSVSATSDSAILTSGNPSTGVNTPYLTVNYIIRVL
jgi:microcystin-dependent protein